MLTKLEFVKQRKLPSPAEHTRGRTRASTDARHSDFRAFQQKNWGPERQAWIKFQILWGKKKLRSHTHCNKQHEPTQYLASGWWRKICPGLHHSARACQQKQVALSKLWGMTAALLAHRNALCCTECQGNEWVSKAREERRKHCLENKWDICTQVCEPVWCQRPLVLRNISSSKSPAREKNLFPPWLAGHQ